MNLPVTIVFLSHMYFAFYKSTSFKEILSEMRTHYFPTAPPSSETQKKHSNGFFPDWQVDPIRRQ